MRGVETVNSTSESSSSAAAPRSPSSEIAQRLTRPARASSDTTVSSSLFLQQLLFYNYYLSPVWFVAVVFIIVYRVSPPRPTPLSRALSLPTSCALLLLLLLLLTLPILSQYGWGLEVTDPDEIRTAVLFLWLLAEPVRLWTGYSGNLRENVPILLVFWLLTFFVSTPVSIYFSFAQKDIKPYDKGINVTVLVLLLLELAGGVYAVSQGRHPHSHTRALSLTPPSPLSLPPQAFKILKSQTRKYYLEDYRALGVEKIHTS